MAKQAGWHGRGGGTAAGMGLAAVAGWLGSWPEYISAAPAGLSTGAVGAVVGFAAGAWWDRRIARLENERLADERWAGVFSDGPTVALPVQGADRDFAADRDCGADLLLPQHAVVGFERAHLKHVTSIRNWCTGATGGRVRLLAGGPGAGKTRVALRVAQQLRGHAGPLWDCGWLRRGPETGKTAIRVAASWHRPVLIIVDDADLYDDLPALLSAAHRAGEDQAHQVRILLVAREFGAWWDHVRQDVRVGVDTDADHSWIGPLGADLPDQRVAVRRAIGAFATRVGTPVNARDAALHGVQPGTPAIRLHAMALEAVLQAGEGYYPSVDVDDAVARLLAREVDRWVREARRHNLTHYPQVTETVLRDILALATLVGGRDEAGAVRLLEHVPNLRGLTPELAGKLLTWMHLYGVVVGYHARPHLPAVLAETLAVAAIGDDTDVARAVVRMADTPEQISYALAVLARATAHHARAANAVSTLLRVDPLRLLPIAIVQAHRGVADLDAAVADAVAGTALPWAAANGLYEQAATSTPRLGRTSVALATTLVGLAPTEALRADALDKQCAALVLTNRWHEAVEPARKAAGLRRRLARDDSDEQAALLAGPLTVLAGALYNTGRPDEAVEPARQAVTLRERLAVGDPDRHLPLLPGALTILAGALRDAEDPSTAVVFARKAVALRRRLARTDADRHLPLLPGDLITLASVLHQVRADVEAGADERSDRGGRRKEAVALAEEAVTRRQRLVADGHSEHADLLPGALTLLASALFSDGRVDEAIEVARRAVAQCRRLALAEPDRHRRRLPAALAVLACALEQAAYRSEAKVHAAEAVALRDSLDPAERTQQWSVFPAPLAHLSAALSDQDEDRGEVDFSVPMTATLLAVTEDNEVITSYHDTEPGTRSDSLFGSFAEIEDRRPGPHSRATDPVRGLAVMIYDAARPDDVGAFVLETVPG
jgi:tetratricopeptide (TPR) repeat protein